MRPEVIQGDVREVIKTLDSESIQCVVTSPPYWGLRDYGVDDQLGLEATPEKYVENIVNVFREVKRVLKDDGTVWLNLGDSYCGTGHKGNHTDPKHKEGRNGQKFAINNKVEGLKSKDLIGIPWRVALALQSDGWYLRSDIIWNKPNPMPESVKDRPTKSHEYIFLLTKSGRYYYDADAIRMPLAGANKRSVWEITTKPYKGSHFATFPEELPQTCIKAGTKKGDLVLDIFAGSGTTLRVASKLGRKGIGIELNPEYIKILKKRCKIESMSLEAFA